jgi:hypothetical protein
MHSLVEMLKYRRPQGSKTQELFCKRYIEPVFGKPDCHGNYVLHLGDSPICFTSHHDTVHTKDGFQIVTVSGDIVTTSDKDSNCLGADCTTGVWLILGMIESGIAGTYVIHASEESGCIGSRALLEDSPLWLEDTKAVISFDRKGQESIVTHQMGIRTCSDSFAVSLSQALNMPMLRPDNTGVYTDSESYAHKIAECTNISVGYLAQHTKQESQDLYFADCLLEALIKADWQSLVFERNQEDYFSASDDYYWRGFDRGIRGKTDHMSELEDICFNYPDAIASILDSYGITPEDLYPELGIDSRNRDFY